MKALQTVAVAVLLVGSCTADADSAPTGASIGEASSIAGTLRLEEAAAADREVQVAVDQTLQATSGRYSLSLTPDPDTERSGGSLQVEAEFAPGGVRAGIGLDLVTTAGPQHQLGGKYPVQWIDTFELVDLGVAAAGSRLLLLHIELFNPRYEEGERWVVIDETFYGPGIGEGHLATPVDVLDWRTLVESLRGFSTDVAALGETPGLLEGTVDLRKAAADAEHEAELDALVAGLEASGIAVEAVPATVGLTDDNTVSTLELRFSDDAVLVLSLADLGQDVPLPAVPAETSTVSEAFEDEVISLNALIYGE